MSDEDEFLGLGRGLGGWFDKICMHATLRSSFLFAWRGMNLSSCVSGLHTTRMDCCGYWWRL